MLAKGILLSACVMAEIYTACHSDGMFALTFDQGPSPSTGRLLKSLSKHQAKATFHITTDYLQNPVIVAYLRKAASDGHLIGLWVKESVASDKSQLKSYLEHSAAQVKKHINYEPQFLRFPNPGPTADILAFVTQRGYIFTTYNLDSQDYSSTSESGEKHGTVFRTIKSTLDMIEPPALGSFIAVQSDLVDASVTQSDAIIDYVKKKGYKLVRLDECVGQKQIETEELLERSEEEDANIVNGLQHSASDRIFPSLLMGLGLLACLF